MRGRPDIDLRVPPVVHPGQEVELELFAHSRSDTPIDFIELTFEGSAVLFFHASAQPGGTPKTIVRQVLRLRDAGTLAAGNHRFATKIRLPDDAPASYLGARATIRYELLLHVSIPWWPDLRETYELVVERRAPSRPRPQPKVATSGRGNEPFIELSLADTAFSLDDEVSGAFAVGNVPRDGAAVEIALVAVEEANVDGTVFPAEQLRHLVPGELRIREDGGEVPFRFRVPPNAVPSFEGPACKLSWTVHAALRLSWAKSMACSIPVVIDRYTQPRERGRPRLEIGAGRWRRAWSEAGERHALVLVNDEGADRLALAGTRGEAQIEVALDHEEDEAAFVATLKYPSLGLDLHVAPQFLIVLPTAIELMLPGCKVEARELEQASAFLGGPFVACLRAFKALRIDDTSTVVRSPATGFDAASIASFLDRTSALTDALIEAIEKIPPPSGMREALPAWRAFAESTGARLCPGGMALTAASMDGAVFDIATRFGPRAEITGTRIELQIDPPLETPVSLSDPATFAAAPPGTREVASALRASVQDLHISPQTLAVDIERPTQDPADLREKMVEMLMLARRLRGDRSPGPYR